jgi:hypothetical protein
LLRHIGVSKLHSALPSVPERKIRRKGLVGL